MAWARPKNCTTSTDESMDSVLNITKRKTIFSDLIRQTRLPLSTSPSPMKRGKLKPESATHYYHLPGKGTTDGSSAFSASSRSTRTSGTSNEGIGNFPTGSHATKKHLPFSLKSSDISTKNK
jgi:hypothetical protein